MLGTCLIELFEDVENILRYCNDMKAFELKELCWNYAELCVCLTCAIHVMN